MPRRKNRHQDPYADWVSGDTDESYTNSNDHNLADQANARRASEHRDSNGNIYTNNHAGGARSHQGKVSNSSQPEHQVPMGPWTSAVGETLRNLEETHRTINNLQTIFMSHKHDLERVDETSRMLHQLEEDCKQKDKEMEIQENTILTLTKMGTKTETELEQKAAQIEEDRNELNQEREKHEKRVAIIAAEGKLKVKQDLEKLMTQYEEIYEKRKQELEDEAAQKRDENDRRAAAFEAEKERLLTTVKEQALQIEAQAQELNEDKEQYDILERAKNSFKNDMEVRQAELTAVKKEFALDPRPMDYFMRNFAEIESQIENISGKYFHSIERKDLEKLHKEMAAADPLFESVPIDDSEDSRDLCTAHAQRVISKAICEDIWKPFGSEFTALQPESSSVLSKIWDEIDQSDHGGRTAKFWNARTMRALKSLRANSVTSPDSKSTGYAHPARTGSVISKVFVLSPLLNSSQHESLRTDLVNLVNSAVDVWDNGQAGGSTITVSLLLDRAHHEEWRSQQFDPVCESDPTNPNQTPTTRSRIFPLFPRVLAPGVENSENNGNGLPGSWPADSNLIVIHPGKGLPDWSPLVVRGQDAEEERKDHFRAAYENAKKQLQSNKRSPGNGRRGSRGSVSSGSPSEQWKRGVVHEFIET